MCGMLDMQVPVPFAAWAPNLSTDARSIKRRQHRFDGDDQKLAALAGEA